MTPKRHLTYSQWCQLADIYLEHLDPDAPENALVIHIAQEEMELDRLERLHRLPAW